MSTFSTAIRGAVAGLLIALGACASREAAEDWRSYEAAAQRHGLMRTERAPGDLVVSNAQLIRNFREIMFYDEFIVRDGVFVPGRMRKRLHKFTGQVRYRIGGDALTDEDRQHVADIAGRLRAITGLEILESDRAPHIAILFLSREQRHARAEDWATSDEWSPLAHDLRNDLPDVICAAYYFADSAQDLPTQHIIIIPGEIAGLLRRSCIEEEFGQAFGPSADFSGARPSIFNDDEEFALFTEHDEMLFRILYDPRLRAGMTEDEALPIIRAIVAELRPSDGDKSGGADRYKPALDG